MIKLLKENSVFIVSLIALVGLTAFIPNIGKTSSINQQQDLSQQLVSGTPNTAKSTITPKVVSILGDLKISKKTKAAIINNDSSSSTSTVSSNTPIQTTAVSDSTTKSKIIFPISSINTIKKHYSDDNSLDEIGNDD